MNTDIHSDPTTNQLPEAAGKISKKANAAASGATNAAKDATRHVSDTAKDMYRSASVKTGETLETSRDYVRRNPVPVVLGAVAFGAALGCMVMMARRKPTFGERYAGEPLDAVRDAIANALSPVTHRVHQGYDSARDGAGKAMNRFHRAGSGRTCDSFSAHVGRIGNNLKFW